MPIKFIYIQRMSDDAQSDTSASGESLGDVMAELKEQMNKIYVASRDIDRQVTDVYARAKDETLDWLVEPLIPKPHLREWLETNGYSNRISMDDFLDICYNTAKNMDLESRILTFHTKDAVALWNGQRRLTVFDILACIPSLFE